MPAGLANYAVAADVHTYLPNLNASEDGLLDVFAGVVSRAMDGWTSRFFYFETGAVKYFDVEGDPTSGTIIRSAPLQIDFFGATTVKIAQRENADPGVTGDWVTLTGDGSTPPSDFFLEPANETFIGKTGDTNRKPFSRIELPATAPSTSTTFQNGFMVGKRTLAVTPAGGWGWPAIPDELKNICAKAVVRWWRAKEASFGGTTGSPETGTQVIQRYLDIEDIATLNRYKRYTVA